MKRTMLVMMAVLLAASAVSAQGIGIGPQLGIQKGADADEAKYFVGGALRLKLTSFIGAEGSINYRQEEYAEDAVTVRQWPVLASGMLYVLPVAHITVGVGWYHTTFDFDVDQFSIALQAEETEQEFGWHFGGGVELPLGTNLSLTGDLKYVFIDYDWEEIPLLEDQDNDFYVIHVGLLFGI